MRSNRYGNTCWFRIASRRLIDCFTRQENDQWLLTSASHEDAVLQLASIDCTLPLADVYEKVTFGAEQAQ